MPKIYSTVRRGHRVEEDNSLFVATRLRLLVDGFRADESASSGARLGCAASFAAEKEDSPPYQDSRSVQPPPPSAPLLLRLRGG